MLAIEASTTLREFDLDVALGVDDGACMAIAGPSGAGKSSVLRIAAGLLHPTAGRVSCGEDVWLDTSRGVALAPERRHCGFLFQSYALFPNMRSWENVAYGIRGSRNSRRSAAHELLERFELGSIAETRPRELSGGERQRVALARALAQRPRALLLDEPLSALDTRTRAGAGRRLTEALAAAGVPSLLVTHDFEEAALFGDEVAILDRGQVVQRGTPQQLADAPASAFVADFTGAVVLTGVATSSEDGLTTVRLDGGGVVRSTDIASGRVSLSVHPWELALEPPGSGNEGSALNRVEATVESVTEVGNRARVGLRAGQHLTAEITAASARRLGLARGRVIDVTWKATATRLIPLAWIHPTEETR
jgi:molybdate transport system ATP-binding protein